MSRAIYRAAGRIKRFYVATCAGCARQTTEIAKSKQQAIRIATWAGWREVGGDWYCHECDTFRNGKAVTK